MSRSNVGAGFAQLRGIRGMTLNVRTRAKPRELPWAADLKDFNLSLDFLRTCVKQDITLFGEPLSAGVDTRTAGFFNPPVGQFLGQGMAARMGALLSRPTCVFVNSFLWRFDPCARMDRHIDRSPLDITMSIPVVLDGVDAWPVGMQQPDGSVLEWASQPGTALIFDGRWRHHWRDAFLGTQAIQLLLHWRAPAVLWRAFLDQKARARLRKGTKGRLAVGADLLERCSELARLAVPPSASLELALCDRLVQTMQTEAEDDDALLLVPLDGKLTLTFEAQDPVVLAPGDGIAFPAQERRQLAWAAPYGRGRVLLGHAQTPRSARRVEGMQNV